MAREYFNAYHSILEAMEPLNDAERGRLFTALLVYSSTGAVEKLGGNERFVFPGLRSQIDRDIKKYDDYCLQQSENGKKGGRPPKANESQKTQPFFEKPKKANEKEKDKEKAKTKDKESKADQPPVPTKSTKKSFGDFGWVRLTDDEYNRLLNDLGEAEVKRCIAYVDESAQTTGNKNKWRDWNLVLRKCHRQGWGLRQGNSGSYTHGADRLAAMIGRGAFDD